MPLSAGCRPPRSSRSKATLVAFAASALAGRSLLWLCSHQWRSTASRATGPARLRQPRAESVALRVNLLEMLEDAVGTPTPQAADPPIPSSAGPVDPDLMKPDITAYTLEEKGMSFSGEDFDIKSPTGEVILRVGGGNRLPIPGMPVWDKLTVSTAGGAQIATLDRQAVALTTTYDVNRADGSKFGRINKAMFALTQTFELWQEGDNQPGPLLKAEGSFSDKSYVMKCHQGTVVATVTRLPGFSGNNVDSYQVVVGPHVDASLVLAMAVVIDEVHDEENPAQGGEPLRDMLEDAAGLPLPQAAAPMIPSSMPPLDPALVHGLATAYELEEKALSLTGEDFEIKSPNGELLMRISGGNRIPISGMPVWDKLALTTAGGAQIASLDREMIAMTPTYDVYRADGSKFGKITKAMFGFTEAFEFYLENDGGGPVLKAEGTFSERKYTFKSREGGVVAVAGRGYYQVDNENRYHVVVGAQVDASMVLAMAAIIDEVHDEEHAKEEEGGGGGFPLR